MEDRKVTLLKAARDLLSKQDGYCLIDDIEIELRSTNAKDN